MKLVLYSVAFAAIATGGCGQQRGSTPSPVVGQPPATSSTKATGAPTATAAATSLPNGDGPPALNDASTELGRLVRGSNGAELPVHRGGVTDVAISADDRLVASVGRDRHLRISDASTGKLLHDLKLSEPLQAASGDDEDRPRDQARPAIAIQPQGTLLAAAHDGTLSFVDLETGKLAHQVDDKRLTNAFALRFTAAGDQLVSFGGKTVLVWSTATAEVKLAFEIPSTRNRRIALTPDGRLLACAGAEKSVELYDLTTGKLEHRFTGAQKGDVEGVAIDPEGLVLAAIDDESRLVIYDLKNRKEQFHDDECYGPNVAFAPSGLLAIGGSTIRFYEVGEKAIRNLGRHSLRGRETEVVAFSSDSRRLLAADGGVQIRPDNVVLERSLEQETLLAVEDDSQRFAYSPDGRWIAWEQSNREGNETRYVLHLYSTVERKVVATTTLEPEAGGSQPFVFSPDSKRLAVVPKGMAQGVVRVFQLPVLAAPVQTHTLDWCNAALFTPDGGTLFLFGGDRTQSWNLATNKSIEAGSDDDVDTGAFHSAGVLRLVGVDDGKISLLRATDLKPIKSWVADGPVGSVLVVPNSNRAATWSGRSKIVSIWDLDRADVVLELAHAKNVIGAAATSDGQRLLTHCGDGDIHVWSCDDGRRLGTFPAHFDSLEDLVFLQGTATFITRGNGNDGRSSVVKRWSWPAVEAKLQPPAAPSSDPTAAPLVAERFGNGVRYRVDAVGYTDAGRSFYRLVDRRIDVADASIDDWFVEKAERWSFEIEKSDSLGRLRSLDFSPDGRRFAVAFDPSNAAARDQRKGVVNVYDAAKRELVKVLRLDVEQPGEIRFSPDGRTLAVAAGEEYPARGEVSLWDVEQGTRTAVIPVEKHAAKRVRYSPSGKLLAFDDPQGIAVVDVAAAKVQARFPCVGEVNDIRFSPNDELVVVATQGQVDGRLFVFELNTGKPATWFDDFTEKPFAAAFSTSGERLVVASWHDRDEASYHVFEIPGGKSLGRYTTEGDRDSSSRAGQLVFSPDGSRLASGVFDHAHVWPGPQLLDISLQRDLAKLDDRGFYVRRHNDGFLFPKYGAMPEISFPSGEVGNRGLAKLPVMERPFALDLGSDKSVTNAGLALLAKQKNLRKLDVGWSGSITPAGIAQLKDLPLLWLETGQYKFRTTAELESLSDFKQLEYLSLDVSVRKLRFDMSPLVKLEKLRELQFGIFDAAASSLESIAGLASHLEVLGLGHDTIHTDDDFKYLAPFKKLKSLRIVYTNGPATGAGLKHLADMQELEKLELGGGQNFTARGLDFLPPLKRLKYLDIPYLRVQADGFAPLGRLTALETIRLPDDVTDAHLAHLASLTKLRELDLGQRPVTDAGLLKLDKLTALEKLGLYEAKGITGSGLAAFAGATKLKQLDLKDSVGITDAGLAGVAKLTQLESLTLPPQITDAGLAQLTPLKNLKFVDAGRTKITKAAVEKFKAGYPKDRLNIWAKE